MKIISNIVKFIFALFIVGTFLTRTAALFVGSKGANDYQRARLAEAEAKKNLRIIKTEFTKNGKYFHIKGYVKNEGEQPATYVTVLGKSYDKNKVVDTSWTYAIYSFPLDLEESRNFEISTRFDPRIKTSTNEVVVD